jgi:hypothetical protein
LSGSDASCRTEFTSATPRGVNNEASFRHRLEPVSPSSCGSPIPRNGRVAFARLANVRSARSDDTDGSVVIAYFRAS